MKIKTITLVLVLIHPNLCAQSFPIPAPPKFNAASYVLMDFRSGAVLAEHNPGARVAPASLTKIMTAYLVYQAIAANHVHIEDRAFISEKAWRSVGSRMFVEVGDKVLLEDLLFGVIIQSGNDASVALAEHVAGTEEAFADMMNAQAKHLGLQNTHFVNATGLPHPEHYTTAYDVALLSRQLIKEFPEKYKVYAQKEFTFNGIKQYNRNRLLWRNGTVDGLKTGYTKAAGYSLAASAVRHDMRLISVVMGANNDKSRTMNSQALLNYGFRYYKSHKLYQAGETLAERRMWKGESKSIRLGLSEDLYVTIPRGRYDALQATMNVDSDIVAPIEQGTQVGVVKIVFEGKGHVEKPLIALHANRAGNLWRRATDLLLQTFF